MTYTPARRRPKPIFTYALPSSCHDRERNESQNEIKGDMEMIITVSHEETNFNRSTRKKETREIIEGKVNIDWRMEKAIRELAPKYKMGAAEMVKLVLQCYFGDGANHLNCEYCDLWDECADGKRECRMGLEPGTQTTIPILDKGMVVVGHPASDLG